MQKIKKALNDKMFKVVHGNRLIYNTCWEDPEIDRRLLNIQPDSKIVMITSAGCNALDYLLDHQDWMAGHAPEELEEEWDLILANSRPGAKILFRSAGMDHSFLPQKAQTALEFMPRQSEPLHQNDRVGTYGSLHFARVLAV